MPYHMLPEMREETGTGPPPGEVSRDHKQRNMVWMTWDQPEPRIHCGLHENH